MEDKQIQTHNQAEYEQARLDAILTKVNALWANPTAFDEVEGTHNYRIIYQSLRSYFSEIRTKGDEELTKLGDELGDLISSRPIINSRPSVAGYYRIEPRPTFNHKLWSLINTKLREYQDKILEKTKSKSRSGLRGV